MSSSVQSLVLSQVLKILPLVLLFRNTLTVHRNTSLVHLRNIPVYEGIVKYLKQRCAPLVNPSAPKLCKVARNFLRRASLK